MRPMSSVFKPAVYLAALEQGLITPVTLLPDQPLTYARRAAVPPGEAPVATRLSHLVSAARASAAALTTLPVLTALPPLGAGAAASGAADVQRLKASGSAARSSGAAVRTGAGAHAAAEEGRVGGGGAAEEGAARKRRGGKEPADEDAAGRVVAQRSRDDLERARAFLMEEPEAGGEWTCASTSCPLSLSSPVPPKPPRRSARPGRGARRAMHRQLACIAWPWEGRGEANPAGTDGGGVGCGGAGVGRGEGDGGARCARSEGGCGGGVVGGRGRALGAAPMGWADGVRGAPGGATDCGYRAGTARECVRHHLASVTSSRGAYIHMVCMHGGGGGVRSGRPVRMMLLRSKLPWLGVMRLIRRV